MLCEKCGKNTATVIYTQVINGQKSSLNICSECASRESIFDNFGSLLSFGTRESSSNTVCKCCGMSLSEFMRRGNMGCGECYSVFRPYAAAMLKKIHGTQKHVSDSPETPAPKTTEAPKSELDKLRDDLKKAIESENFEDAALLRDKIRNIENSERNEQ